MSLDPDEIKAFKDTSLGDVLEEAYDRSYENKHLIEDLVDQLSGLIEDEGDAATLVPVITDYMEISVKNNEQLLQLSQVVQRMYNATMRQQPQGDDDEATGSDLLSDADKDYIREVAEDIDDTDYNELTEKAQDAAEKVDKELDLGEEKEK